MIVRGRGGSTPYCSQLLLRCEIQQSVIQGPVCGLFSPLIKYNGPTTRGIIGGGRVAAIMSVFFGDILKTGNFVGDM